MVEENVNLSSAEGSAHDAQVQIIESGDVATLDASQLAEADAKIKEENRRQLQANHDGLAAKVEKLQGHLEGAKAALAEAEAKLDGAGAEAAEEVAPTADLTS